jgi:hypothetical protein
MECERLHIKRWITTKRSIPFASRIRSVDAAQAAAAFPNIVMVARKTAQARRGVRRKIRFSELSPPRRRRFKSCRSDHFFKRFFSAHFRLCDSRPPMRPQYP